MAQLQYKTKPFEHQHVDLDRTKDLRGFAYFWEMGLGKTKVALDLAAYLYNLKAIDAVLFVTKNGVDTQVIDEAVPTHLALLDNQYMADKWRDWDHCWPKLKKFGNTICDRLFIAAINVEALGTARGLAAIKELLSARRCLLVVDESQEFANLTALRTQNMVKIAPMAPFRRLMSGTPTGGNPVHLYSQMSILNPSIFPESIFAFEYKYCVKEDTKVWYKDKKTGLPMQRTIKTTVGYKNLDALEARIAPYISRRLKIDCLDLPEKIYKAVPFELSAEERTLYNKIKNQTLVEVAAGKYVDTDMAVKKLLRLQQVACGFVTFEDLVTGQKGSTLLPKPTRLRILMQYLRMVHGKALIWSRFTLSIEHIIDEIKKEFGEQSVVRYDGSVPENQRHTNKMRLKQDPTCRFLVGHPQAGGVGLDLPEAQDTFYYSNDHKLITRLQSEDRNHRIGSKGAVTYYDLSAIGTVDSRIIRALRERFDIAAQLNGDQLRQWISE